MMRRISILDRAFAALRRPLRHAASWRERAGRSLALVGWALSLLSVGALAGCDRPAARGGRIVAGDVDHAPDLAGPPVYRASLRLLSSNAAPSVSPALVAVDGDQLELALVANDPGALLGYAFHLVVSPPGGLRLADYTFGEVLHGGNAETVEKLAANGDRLIGASVRFRHDDRGRAPSIVVRGTPVLLSIRFAILGPGVFQLRFPAPHHEARDGAGLRVPLRFVDAELRIEVAR
ncbi:MAG: hypothetical protein KC609_14260 [Myxococcales bacterium]|nr:hypothetical protein [Myxococcales bacterium]